MVEITENQIKLELTPEQVFESFPTDFLPDGQKVEHGFADRPLNIPGSNGKEIKYSLSYDGELELIAVVTENPEDLDLQSAKCYLTEFLGLDEDEDHEDEDEDEDDDEDE